MQIDYREDANISVEYAIDLYKQLTRGERRSVDRPNVFEGMLKHANLVISAWDSQRLIGIVRSLSDFTYVTDLADPAIDAEYQKSAVLESN